MQLQSGALWSARGHAVQAIAVRLRKTVHLVFVALFVLAAAPSGVAWANSVTISMKDKQFVPTEIVVDRGTTVMFSNDDTAAHNVMSHSPGAEFDLQLQHPGETRSYTFDKAGQYTIGCDLHPRMMLTITVK